MDFMYFVYFMCVEVMRVHRATWENTQWLNVLPCINILEKKYSHPVRKHSTFVTSSFRHVTFVTSYSIDRGIAHTIRVFQGHACCCDVPLKKHGVVPLLLSTRGLIDK